MIMNLENPEIVCYCCQKSYISMGNYLVGSKIIRLCYTCTHKSDNEIMRKCEYCREKLSDHEHKTNTYMTGKKKIRVCDKCMLERV